MGVGLVAGCLGRRAATSTKLSGIFRVFDFATMPLRKLLFGTLAFLAKTGIFFAPEF
jgi:hypothetical protein